MTTFPLQPSIKHEESDGIADLHTVKKFSCSLCGTNFSQESLLLNHFCKDVENHADRMGAVTTLQNKPFEEEKQITVLLYEFLPTEPMLDIKVEEVEFTETTVSGFPCPDPLKTEPPDKLFQSINYEYATTLSTLFTDHVEDRNAEEPCKGNIGDYSTTHSMLLRAHKQSQARKTSLKERTDLTRMHSELKKFKCTRCDYACRAQWSLTQHMRKHTGEKPFKCTLCDYASANRSSLGVHMRTHTGEKPFKCTMCDYASATNVTLTNHMRTHTGDKPFKCTLCDYASVDSSTIRVHMRKHTGEKPFKCTLCDYASAKNAHLTNHMTTHTGEKQFKCILCDYATAHSSSLRVHMRKHTGERPFKCTLCDYASVNSSALRVHMRKHTGEKPFKCTVCAYASAHKFVLTQHMRWHRGETV